MNPSQDPAVVVVVVILVIFAIIFVAIPAIIIGIAVPISVHRHKYMDFVENYSSALRGVKEINTKYSFYEIPDMDMEHKYDNDDFYPNVSCEDYLIYQLQFASMQGKVRKAIHNTYVNKDRFKAYKEELATCHYGEFVIDTEGYKLDTLMRYEKEMVEDIIYSPQTIFDITVTLKRTDINGEYKESKHQTFSAYDIENIMGRLNDKKGTYYRDPDIWNAIVRVERAKVSNRMRFAIFKRDNERCKCCGSRRNLEIDHIIPVSKGGKSTMDNLQTLCHRCNVRKGNNVE